MNKSLDVTVYPNPTSERITINTDDFIGGKIIINNLEGRIVYENSINSGKTIISTSSFHKGSYLISVKLRDKFGSCIFVVQ